MGEVSVEAIYRPERDPELAALLKANDLTLPEEVDEGVGLYEDGRLVGCGFLKGNLLQGVAVDAAHRGEGLSATLITALIQRAVQRGITYWQVITKPDMERFFAGLGFRRVADARPYAVLLEAGSGSASAYAEDLRRQAEGRPAPRACVVMNANPFTLGHLDLVQRALELFDTVYVAIGCNADKRTLYPVDSRKAMIADALRGYSGVQIEAYEGLTVQFCQRVGAQYILRGLRSSIDFEYEKTIAQANGIVDTRVETVFLMARAEHAPISSTVVRDLIRHGGDASAFLPEGIDLSRYPKNQ